MRTLRTADGAVLPVVGQGTWTMGEHARNRAQEVAALRLGLDLGMTLIDTAEMYAGGGAEEVVGEAIAGRREQVFLVTKVLPENASRRGTVAAAERSLRRLRTDWIDLYLLHWPSHHPLAETFAAFAELLQQGRIRRFGVSNFDLADLGHAQAVAGGAHTFANQVLYNPARRGIERALLAGCADAQVLVMGYSPLDQNRLRLDGALTRVAQRHGASPAQVAIAWSVRGANLVTIPKSSRPEHVRANGAAADLTLSAQDLAEIDREFPAPDHDVPLETA